MSNQTLLPPPKKGFSYFSYHAVSRNPIFAQAVALYPYGRQWADNPQRAVHRRRPGGRAGGYVGVVCGADGAFLYPAFRGGGARRCYLAYVFPVFQAAGYPFRNHNVAHRT